MTQPPDEKFHVPNADPATMAPMRDEHDSLGVVRVPIDALFGAQTMRAIDNFPVSGRTAHPALTRGYLRLKRAAAKANEDCGVLPRASSQLIARAVQELLAMPESDWPKVFPVDVYQAGAGTSQNMNVNEVIANVANRLEGHALGSYAPLHPNDHVNLSQSTNDSFPTAMRVALVDASRELVREVAKLAVAFDVKSRAWADIPKSARTHLQDAVPMRLGQEASAWSATCRRLARHLESSREELRELGIGGSAAGTGLNVPRGYRDAVIRQLSAATGEKFRGAPDLCEAMQSQAPVGHYSAMLRLTALELTRICNDLRLLASGPMTGLAELRLPAVQPGSSIMPGKVNPSILEMCNQAMMAVVGCDQTIAMALQAGQLELNVMMPVMAYAGLEATTVAARAIRALRERCVEGLVANEARMRHYFESTPQVATALSPKLGYEATAKLVQQALAEGVSVVELVRRQKLVPEDELRLLLDPRTLTGAKE